MPQQRSGYGLENRSFVYGIYLICRATLLGLDGLVACAEGTGYICVQYLQVC